MPVTRRARAGERGQTAPFWAVAVLMSLTLAFFTFNYANSVRWQVRAQNAADSAATALLGQDAAAANDLTTLTYAMDIQTVRDESIQNAAAGLLGDVGTNPECLSVVATSCVTQFTNIATAESKSTTNYVALANQVQGYEGQFTDIVGNSASATALLNNSLFSSNPTDPTQGCVRLQTDCGFKYTASISAAPGGTGEIIADVYACRLVPTAVAGVISPIVAKESNTFYAIGHARETLAPASSGYTDPGTTQNGILGNGSVLNPVEQISPGFTASEGFTSFADVNIAANYLIPKAAPPSTATAQSISTLCPAVSP